MTNSWNKEARRKRRGIGLPPVRYAHPDNKVSGPPEEKKHRRLEEWRGRARLVLVQKARAVAC